MQKVFSWFATSPLSTAARIGIGAALTYIVDNIAGFNLSPAMQVLIVAGVASAMRYLNPADGVFGVGATTVDSKDTDIE